MFRQEMFFQQPSDLAADDASTDWFHNVLPVTYRRPPKAAVIGGFLGGLLIVNLTIGGVDSVDT